MLLVRCHTPDSTFQLVYVSKWSTPFLLDFSLHCIQKDPRKLQLGDFGGHSSFPMNFLPLNCFSFCWQICCMIFFFFSIRNWFLRSKTVKVLWKYILTFSNVKTILLLLIGIITELKIWMVWVNFIQIFITLFRAVRNCCRKFEIIKFWKYYKVGAFSLGHPVFSNHLRSFNRVLGFQKCFIPLYITPF